MSYETIELGILSKYKNVPFSEFQIYAEKMHDDIGKKNTKNITEIFDVLLM